MTIRRANENELSCCFSELQFSDDFVRDLVQSVRVTSWPDISNRIRLRLPSRLGWILVRSEPSDQPSTIDDASRSSSAFQLPLATSVVCPFIDFDRAVVEVRPALLASWQRSKADIYNMASTNLLAVVEPTVDTANVRGCEISVVGAGYWTTGLVYDFNQLFVLLENQVGANLIDSQIQNTLLIGANYIIWCCNHSTRGDSQHRCAIYGIAASLRQSVGSTRSGPPELTT